MNARAQLSEEDFERFHDLILARTGMVFGPRRRDALTRGVLEAARRADRENLEAYYRLLLQARTDSELWDDLIGAITVGETYFFRNAPQFDALRQHILPALIARHQHDRRLRIWSAGCASGEEPYSLAVLLHELLPDIAQWNIFILATDINKRALHQAREGRYREWSFRTTDPAIRQRYFSRQNDHFELAPHVQKMVTFAYLNLAEDAYPSLATNTNALDLILCRNVSIYLPEIVILGIAARFYRCLVADGWLLVGAAETSAQVFRLFESRNFDGATVYQKTPQPPDKETRRLSTSRFLAPSGRQAAFPPRDESPARADLGLLRPEDKEAGRDVSLLPRVIPSPPPEPAPPPKAKTPAELCEKARTLIEQGRYEDARIHLQECLEVAPDFALAHSEMARILANQGRLKRAYTSCQQAIERDPLLTEAYYILALIYQEGGELEKAIAQFKKVLYLDPDFVLAHFSLVHLYQRAGQPQQASRHRAQSIRLAAKMPPDEVVPGSEGLTVGRLLTMVQATL